MPRKRVTDLQPSGYVSRKRKSNLTKKSVLKMLAVMEASQSNNPPKGEAAPPTPESEEGSPEDFLQSGRTGRRNALANILGEHAIVTSSGLPSQLEQLTTKDSSEKPAENTATTSTKS